MSGFEIFEIWIMAFFTIALLSFLYKDNPVYKVAEHIFAGLSAGYYVGLIWDTVIVQQLWNPMIGGSWWLIVPGLLGVLMFARFTKNYSWVSRTPLAFVMAVTAGIFLISQLHGMVLAQVQSTMVPRYDVVPLVELPFESHQNLFVIADSAVADGGPVSTNDLTVSRAAVNPWSGDTVVLAARFVDPKTRTAEDYAITVRLRDPGDQRKIVLVANATDSVPGVSFTATGENAWEARYVFRPDSSYAAGPYDISVLVARKEVRYFLTALILIGVIATLIYFYFSKEHTGALGVTAKVGIWFIMISFGAHFGYTVMGRVSLLIGRVQFLIEDWLGSFSSIF